jgi:signal transduction histidine kinase
MKGATRWPHTLFGRLMLILLVGLVVAEALTFVLVFAERGLVMRGMMVPYLAADVASSVAMLDRLPVAEREGWLPRLQRANYRLRLGVDPEGAQPMQARDSALASDVTQALSQALSQPVQAAHGTATGVAMHLALHLQDGTPVTVDLAEPRLRVSPWVVGALGAQLALLVGVCALAVRQVTRPLAQLTQAAASLAPGQIAPPLSETGPHEVAQAAWAFNRMRERIDEHLSERTQMLAAISHDLQTPITRMRLRSDLVVDEGTRDKLQADLAQMQHLVEQGLAYARSAHATQEAEVPTDLVALLESIVADYQDASQNVQWLGGPAFTLSTRPRALRRAIGNLIDNALKFGGQADVSLSAESGQAVVKVMDRGPGIPESELDKVLQPFYRIESSRNPFTGGTGLGLAIVQRLLPHCRAELHLVAREGGGLQACVQFVGPPSPPTLS